MQPASCVDELHDRYRDCDPARIEADFCFLAGEIIRRTPAERRMATRRALKLPACTLHDDPAETIWDMCSYLRDLRERNGCLSSRQGPRHAYGAELLSEVRAVSAQYFEHDAARMTPEARIGRIQEIRAHTALALFQIKIAALEADLGSVLAAIEAQRHPHVVASEAPHRPEDLPPPLTLTGVTTSAPRNAPPADRLLAVALAA